MFIGHWVAEGQVTGRSCNLEEGNASNVFPCKGGDASRIPVELAATLIAKFSFEGQWVLDLTSSNGGGIQAGLSANRNVVCLEESELELRKSAAMINSAKAAEGGDQEKSEDEIDGEGTVELTQDGEN
ncbi:PREDICTED: uncharacterized protein LOC107327744 [Acropora digitifera]|uniref:uncharacterized protein LOC107327744 n=1 Tax=Acropora digitifera TaxID=70779 RepID=UPI00077A76F0|nr:PREDICTED: uncharacterized protein LOC107327744 [Acropora digitifera]